MHYLIKLWNLYDLHWRVKYVKLMQKQLLILKLETNKIFNKFEWLKSSRIWQIEITIQRLKFQQCNSSKSFNKSNDLTSSYDSNVVKWFNIDIETFYFQTENQIVFSKIQWLSKYSSQLRLTYSRSMSSSLSRCHFQNKSISNHKILIKFRSNVCKQKFNKRICTNHWINIWSRKCFRHSIFSIEYIQLIFFYCFSKSRTFFSSNFLDFNKTSTKSKKFFFRIFIRFRKAFRIDYAFFCFFSSLNFSDFNETSTINEKSSNKQLYKQSSSSSSQRLN